MLPRRTIIPAVLALCLVLAGCSGVLHTVVRHDVTVVNDDDSTHEARVTITEGGSTVLDETRRIGPGSRWDVASIDEEGDYRVVVRTAEGGGVSTSYSLPLVEGDRKSFLDVRIEEDGTLGELLYWQS